MSPAAPDQIPPELRCSLHPRCRGDHAAEEALAADREARLARLGGILGRPLAPPTPRLPARARVTLRPDDDGRLGFTRPRSHDPLPVAWCGLAHPRIQAVMASLPAMPPGLASLELRTDGASVVAAARARKPRFRKRLAAALRALALPVDGIAVDGRAVAGEPSLHLDVAGVRHRLSPGTFFQVQLDTNADLVGAVLSEVEAAAATAVLDLYAGCGNLGLALAAAEPGRRVVLVESAASACADARHTAAAHGLEVEVRQGDAGAFQAGDAFFDLAILDPPRAGAPGVLGQLLLTRPAAIVFVSCNPGLLARDLRPALDAGYVLSRLEAFDMFPGTEHLEVLAVLRRS